MEALKQFSNYSVDSDILYTFIIYDMPKKSVLEEIAKQIDSAKNIQNTFKKQKICTRLYNFQNMINNIININCDESEAECIVINSIYLLDETVIYTHKLSEDNFYTAQCFGLRNFYMKIDTHFHIDFIIGFFTNFSYIYHLSYKTKTNCTLYELNRYKSRVINTYNNVNDEKLISIMNMIKDGLIDESTNSTKKKRNTSVNLPYDCTIFISSEDQKDKINKVLTSNNLNNSVYTCFTQTNQSVIELHERFEMLNNHTLLQHYMNNLTNPKYIDLFVFGKLKVEIKEAIENYQLKELFIEKRKLEKLKEILPEDCFNFNIYLIEAIEQGDVADQFINSYNGLLGVKYF